MEKEVLRVVTDQVEQGLSSGPHDLQKLAEKLAIWTVKNTTNDDLSKLRDSSFKLAGAIMDWCWQLYPDEMKNT